MFYLLGFLNYPILNNNGNGNEDTTRVLMVMKIGLSQHVTQWGVEELAIPMAPSPSPFVNIMIRGLLF